MLDRLRELHQIEYDAKLDPAIEARIAQYEMAYRMQTSVPEVTDRPTSPTTSSTSTDRIAPDPGTFAANCLLARRLAERDVRFIQLYHPGWDQHDGLPGGIRQQCRETDQACAALITDLKQRGLLDDTLVVWGGEFGRDELQPGQADRHRLRPRPSPPLLHRLGGRRRHQAGHHVRRDRRLRLQRRRDGVHVHDFHATILRLLGVDHERLDLQAPGAVLPADGCVGERGQGDLA